MSNASRIRQRSRVIQLKQDMRSFRVTIQAMLGMTFDWRLRYAWVFLTRGRILPGILLLTLTGVTLTLAGIGLGTLIWGGIR